jgi:hypothetical protein
MSTNGIRSGADDDLVAQDNICTSTSPSSQPEDTPSPSVRSINLSLKPPTLAAPSRLPSSSFASATGSQNVSTNLPWATSNQPSSALPLQLSDPNSRGKSLHQPSPSLWRGSAQYGARDRTVREVIWIITRLYSSSLVVVESVLHCLLCWIW